MITSDEPAAIRFSKCDAPELPEIEDCDSRKEREVQRLRNEENLRWLEKHMGFRPFGVEW